MKNRTLEETNLEEDTVLATDSKVADYEIEEDDDMKDLDLHGKDEVKEDFGGVMSVSSVLGDIQPGDGMMNGKNFYKTNIMDLSGKDSKKRKMTFEEEVDQEIQNEEESEENKRRRRRRRNYLNRRIFPFYFPIPPPPPRPHPPGPPPPGPPPPGPPPPGPPPPGPPPSGPTPAPAVAESGQKENAISQQDAVNIKKIKTMSKQRLLSELLKVFKRELSDVVQRFGSDKEGHPKVPILSNISKIVDLEEIVFYPGAATGSGVQTEGSYFAKVITNYEAKDSDVGVDGKPLKRAFYVRFKVDEKMKFLEFSKEKMDDIIIQIDNVAEMLGTADLKSVKLAEVWEA